MSAGALNRPGRDSFATTHWSVVLNARGPDPAAGEALGELIRAYWYPVYAFFRRKSGSPHRAEDLTQGLFTHLIEGHALGSVDPSRGRFRSFLMACCENFLSNDRARNAALKRGGGAVPLSLDREDAESRYSVEAVDHLTPERLYDRAWALGLLEAALRDVEESYRATGKGLLFDRLKPALTAAGGGPTHAAIAAECGMSLAAVKKAAQRLRERYGAALRRRVAETTADEASVADELGDLFQALQSR